METPLDRDIFLECNWVYNVLPEDHFGYTSVSLYLRKSSQEMSEEGKTQHSKILDLLARAASMILMPGSYNEPFAAYYKNFEAGQRTSLPDDFTVEEIVIFENILDCINEPWLHARIADLLWLLKTPKNPKDARLAIDSYVSHSISDQSWHRDVKICWERAARLSMQIRDDDRLNQIRGSLYSAFSSEYPRDKFMTLRIADLLDSLKIDDDLKENIACVLHRKACELKEKGDYNAARAYFELASKKFQQCSEENSWLKALVAIADCIELEADAQPADNNMVANTFYENAMQAYRKIPTKHRHAYGVDEKLVVIRKKITTSGKVSLDEMSEFSIPEIDISDVVQQAREHVSGKRNFEEALLHFAGLFGGPKYDELRESAKELMMEHIFSGLAGAKHVSPDGRIVAKTPAINLGAGDDDASNREALHWQIQKNFTIEIQLVVEGRILPALSKILVEHRFARANIVAICRQSALVPQGREQLLGYALWLGFEYEFGASIHLLCPQVEHIVRSKLKKAGACTSNIDKEGIETENGLSTLMDLPEALELFGENLTFEIKSVFTDVIGFNLRNEVAHGLLDDNGSLSLHSIYAWWMILRLIIHSLLSGNSKEH